MTRIDHSSCTHASTPASRKVCRDNRRARMIEVQAAYMALQTMDAHTVEEGRNYDALVQLLAWDYGISLDDAYELVENGPIAN